MNRILHRGWVAAVFFMILALAPMGALAAKLTQIWVTPADDEAVQADSLPIDAIRWWYSKNDKVYYLFLPAGMEGETLRLWFDGPESITANGKTIHSGDTADFLTPGAKVNLAADSAKFTLRVMQSQNVPAMFLTTESGTVKNIHKSKKNEEKGSLTLLNADGSLAYEGLLSQIKCRGNATFGFTKKAYQIKLDKSTDLYGMGKAKTWILLADHRDNSLLRNKITFALSDAVGMAYTSKSQTVDVYINNDYYGTYLLCEKVEIGDSRIDINNLEKDTEEVNENPLDSYPAFGSTGYRFGKTKGFNIPNDPEDITGGYLLELDYPDRYKKEVSGFVTARGLPVVIKEPEAVSKAQADYISAFIQGFENAVFAEDGIDPESGKHYSEFVDMDSLVKKYLIEEITKNFDGNRSSFYVYKPADDQSTLAFAGPSWDYDISMGNYMAERNQRITRPESFAINNDNGERFYWFPALYKKADFYKAAVSTYYEVFVPALNVLLGLEEEDSGSLRSIDDYAQEITASAAMNYTRWPVFNASDRPAKTGRNYAENIDYVKNFLTLRMAFLQENWPEP